MSSSYIHQGQRRNYASMSNIEHSQSVPRSPIRVASGGFLHPRYSGPMVSPRLHQVQVSNAHYGPYQYTQGSRLSSASYDDLNLSFRASSPQLGGPMHTPPILSAKSGSYNNCVQSRPYVSRSAGSRSAVALPDRYHRSKAAMNSTPNVSPSMRSEAETNSSMTSGSSVDGDDKREIESTRAGLGVTTSAGAAVSTGKVAASQASTGAVPAVRNVIPQVNVTRSPNPQRHDHSRKGSEVSMASVASMPQLASGSEQVRLKQPQTPRKLVLPTDPRRHSVALMQPPRPDNAHTAEPRTGKQFSLQHPISQNRSMSQPQMSVPVSTSSASLKRSGLSPERSPRISVAPPEKLSSAKSSRQNSVDAISMKQQPPELSATEPSQPERAKSGWKLFKMFERKNKQNKPQRAPSFEVLRPDARGTSPDVSDAGSIKSFSGYSPLRSLGRRMFRNRSMSNFSELKEEPSSDDTSTKECVSANTPKKNVLYRRSYMDVRELPNKFESAPSEREQLPMEPRLYTNAFANRPSSIRPKLPSSAPSSKLSRESSPQPRNALSNNMSEAEAFMGSAPSLCESPSTVSNTDAIDLGVSNTVFPRSLDDKGIADMRAAVVRVGSLERRGSKRRHSIEERVPYAEEVPVLQLATSPRLDLDFDAQPAFPSALKNTKETRIVAPVSFASQIIVYDTYSCADYDRRPEPATCNHLTPLLAQQIKQELNGFKLTMTVHSDSRAYTHFF